MNLRTKLLLIFSILTTISLTTVSVIGYLYSANYFTKSINAEMQAQVNMHVNSEEGWILSKTNSVQTVAKMLTKLTGNMQEFPSTYLSANVILDKELKDIYIGTIQGKFLTGTGWVPPADFDPRIRPWYRQAIENNKLIFTEPYIDADTKKYIVSLAMPYQDSTGRLAGVVAEDILLEVLTDKVKTINISENGKGYAILLDEKGNILVYPDKSIMLKNVFEIDSFKHISPIFKEILAKEHGVVQYEYDNTEKMMFYRKIPATGWTLALAIPTEDIYKQLQELKLIFIGSL